MIFKLKKLKRVDYESNYHGFRSSLKKEDNKLILKRCVSTCPHKRKLKEVLLESIQVLEESKKAFKSKQLETLRKKLTRILAEID